MVVSNAMSMSLQPVSIAQPIDTTGSMASFQYMEPAKERAAQLVDFMRTNDRVSVTEFSHRSGLADARTLARSSRSYSNTKGSFSSIALLVVRPHAMRCSIGNVPVKLSAICPVCTPEVPSLPFCGLQKAGTNLAE